VALSGRGIGEGNCRDQSRPPQADEEWTEGGKTIFSAIDFTLNFGFAGTRL
jgi:hypothetical protein